MKKVAFLLFSLTISCCAMSQRVSTTTARYTPMSMQEMELYARAQAAQQAYNKQQFEEYMGRAYERLNELDYEGFIFYSDRSLEFGWYNDKMYYDRGKAYEKLHEYRKAKREYKKAIEVGYYPAKQALEQCKENMREWKKNR